MFKNNHINDIVYYNGATTNVESFPLPIKINDVRGDAIIDNPDDYEMSVVRFFLDNAHSLPIGTLNMQPGASPGVLSDTFLSFTMVFAGVDYQEFVQYARYDREYDAGVLFSFTELLDNMNTALQNILTTIGAGPSVTTPPKFAYDPLTQLISMYFEENYATIGDVEVWMNIPTHNLLFAFPFLTNRFNGPNGKDVQFSFVNGYVKQAPALSGGNRVGFPFITNSIPDNMRYLTQDAIVINQWCNIKSIFLQSDTLSIQSEFLTLRGGINTNDNFSNAYSNIISDYVLSFENPQTDRQKIEYLPTAEYRMISLKGKESIKRISISVWMTLANGRVIPLKLEPGATFSCKLMFRRKKEY